MVNRAHRRAQQSAVRHGRLGPARLVRPFVSADTPEEARKVGLALRLIKRRILDLGDEFVAHRLSPAHVGSALLSMGVECYAVTHVDDPAWNVRWSHLAIALEDTFRAHVALIREDHPAPSKEPKP